jgi:multidrug efflux pump subunit AcrB
MGRHPAWGAGLVALLTAVAFWFGVTHAAYRDPAGDVASASTLRVDLRARRGTDPELVARVLQPFERAALAHPGVAGTRASGAGAEARLLVEFSPSALSTPAPRQLQDRFVARATQVGGLQLLVQGNGPAFQAGAGGSSQSAHRLQLAGYGWEALDSLALALAARLQRTPRIRELRLSSEPWHDEPTGREMRIQPDRGVLRRLELPVGDVAAVVAGAAGGPVGRLILPIDGGDQVVAVREADAASRSKDALLASPLPSSRGQRIRLRDVAVFSERPVPAVITREAQQYVRYLHYEIRGTPRQAHRIQTGLRATVAPPPGFTITDRPTDGDPDTDGTVERPWRTAVLAVLFACLAAAFARNHGGAAMAVLLVLPATMAGALVGRALVGQSVTPESLAAMVLASGVTAQLAVTPVEEGPGPWWTLALTAASTGPFLLCAGPDSPGRLPAAMTLGGIGLGTVAVALTRRVRRRFIHRSSVD